MNMQSTKPTRKTKNQAVSYALITFSYLYAGTVLRKPFYAGGVPLLGLLVSGGALLVFSYVCAAYFAGRAGRGTRAPSGFFAVRSARCSARPSLRVFWRRLPILTPITASRLW